jgi:hypothetical protein
VPVAPSCRPDVDDAGRVIGAGGADAGGHASSLLLSCPKQYPRLGDEHEVMVARACPRLSS